MYLCNIKSLHIWPFNNFTLDFEILFKYQWIEITDGKMRVITINAHLYFDKYVTIKF